MQGIVKTSLTSKFNLLLCFLLKAWDFLTIIGTRGLDIVSLQFLKVEISKMNWDLSNPLRCIKYSFICGVRKLGNQTKLKKIGMDKWESKLKIGYFENASLIFKREIRVIILRINIFF